MKNYITFFVKGLIIWVANIIPGISGGTMAVILWIYEKLLTILSQPFHNFKENLKFLIPFFVGIWSWIIIFANLIEFLLSKFEINTKLFFIWLIIGCIPYMIKKFKIKKEKNNLFFLLGFWLMIWYFFISKDISKESVEIAREWFKLNFEIPNFLRSIKLFLSGAVAATSMVIPGISGSLVLLLMWEYYEILTYIKSFMVIYIWITWCWILTWVFIAIKLINYLLKKYSKQTYNLILWIILWSLFVIFPGISAGIWILWNIWVLVLWFIIAYFWAKLEK